MKILFVLKRGHYGSVACYNNYNTTGLLNSARFVVDMLNEAGEHAKLVVVTDNNDIDREVHQFHPDIVVIEALWVVPEKFEILKQLHPKVRWIVRIHSDLPFLAEEGISVDWILGYLRRGVEVAFNSEKAFEAFQHFYHDKRILYLPNFYPTCRVDRPHKEHHEVLIGSFGAIRPMKNQLTQAVAAITYADAAHKRLKFFINSSRCEHGGESILKNLRALFSKTGHELVETPWLNHTDFLKIVAHMDVVMCVSFTETFCIVAADAVVAGASLVCSSQVPWASSISRVNTTDVHDIAKTIKKVVSWSGKLTSQHLNLRGLQEYSEKSRKLWLALSHKKKSLFRRIMEY